MQFVLCRFEIVIAGGRNYVFGCRTIPELQEWIDALQLSVLQALTLFDLDSNKKRSAQDILTALYTNPGNMECADCKAVNPSWVSLNLCVLVCIDCSGVHRAMGAHISKVPYLLLHPWCVLYISMLCVFRFGQWISTRLLGRLPSSSC